jgi:predicted XRE-type DNA-binding protein
MEQWKAVVGYEGIYEVSSLGRIKKVETGRITLGSLNNGYRVTSLTKDKKISRVRVHRIVCEAFIPNTESKPVVNHINGIKTDNRLENLEWTTSLENNRHANATGLRKQVGSDNSKAKLNEEKVREIKALYQTGTYKQKDLAEMFGVVQTQISKIISGKLWGHVE